MLKCRRGILGISMYSVFAICFLVFFCTMSHIVTTLSDNTDSTPGQTAIQHAIDQYTMNQDIKVLRTQCSSMNTDGVSTCSVSFYKQGSQGISYANLNMFYRAETTTSGGWQVLNVI